jgi:hypothetical protein
MPFPLIPVLVGLGAFVLGAGLSQVWKIEFVEGEELDANELKQLQEYWGCPAAVTLKPAGKGKKKGEPRVIEGYPQDLTKDDMLVVETAEQVYMNIPLQRIQKIELYA